MNSTSRIVNGVRGRLTACACHVLAGCIGIAAVLTLSATPARADGCKVLLCLAGNWQQIHECAPAVRKALRDVARGRGWPRCGMSGSGNGSSHSWSYAPGNCPPQYTVTVEAESGTRQTCMYSGAVRVAINGRPWSTTWWNRDGEDTVIEYSAEAKAQLGSHADTKFEDDYAAWLASVPPAPICSGTDC
jgi:hypothetical protein